MEQNSSLFSLSIDSTSKENLAEAAKWARFLAIVGFVFMGFLVLAGLAFSFMFNRLNSQFDQPEFRNSGIGAAMGVGVGIIYILLALVYFFPLLYLLRFANAARDAVNGGNQELLAASFFNLKRFLRYVGILTIIGLCFMALSIFGSLLGTALVSR